MLVVLVELKGVVDRFGIEARATIKGNAGEVTQTPYALNMDYSVITLAGGVLGYSAMIEE